MQGGATCVGFQEASESKTPDTTGTGPDQLSAWDNAWMTGPMRGWCFRVLQVPLKSHACLCACIRKVPANLCSENLRDLRGVQEILTVPKM